MKNIPHSSNPGVQRFATALLTNPNVAAILEDLDALLPGACLAGGCLFQTVWNELHGFDPTHGILDYDLFYFDDRDLSAEGEREIAAFIASHFYGLDARIEVTNQARVHLWYEHAFGVPSPQFNSCEDGIDAFLAVACCVGARKNAHDVQIYAPHGVEDALNLIVRPNAFRAAQGAALADAYERKVARWKARWPRLTVVQWPP